MDDRQKAINSQGWEEPFDAEPFDSPDSWQYRGLMNTGGYVMCRIWTHKTEKKELLYNMMDSKVAIIGAKYSEEEDKYIGDLGEVVDEANAGDDFTESDLQEVALELLEEHA